MNDPVSPYAPPHLEGGPPKKSHRRLWLFGCGGALLFVLLGAGTCALAVKQGVAAGERELGPPCERYLTEVKAGDYHRAYADFGQAFRATMSEADYTSFDQGIHERIGALQSKTIQAAQTGVNAQGRWGRLIYQCQFEKGPVTLKMELRKEDEEWKVVGFNYGGPFVEETLRTLLKKKARDPATSE